MNEHPLRIWVLADGKRGHANQALGLAEMLARQAGAEMHVIPVPHERTLLGRWLAVRRAAREHPAPEWIVAAGHRSHIPLLLAARATAARSIVIMRPTLPAWLFDLCIVPEHDDRRMRRGGAERSATGRIVVTRGALNRVRYEPAAKDGTALVLVGGPARGYAFDTAALLEAIDAVVAGSRPSARRWVLTTSRRTPPAFIEQAREQMTSVECHDGRETGPDWLPAQLRRAETVWVTPDSVSMVYEALSAGARVGALEMPATGRPGKLHRNIDALVADGYVTPFSRWRETGELDPPPEVLAEAERCAALVLERFPPRRAAAQCPMPVEGEAQ